MLCKKCGVEVSSSDVFCDECGTKINIDNNNKIEKINQMIEKCEPFDISRTKKAIKYLPEVLRSDEEIKYLTSGFASAETWLMVCTNERVIFIDKGMFSSRQIEMPLDKIGSITQYQGLVLGAINIYDDVSSATFENVPKATIKPFIDAVNKSIEELKNKSQDITDNKVDSDPIEKIKRLAELKESGIISEEEFQTQKSRLLGLI